MTYRATIYRWRKEYSPQEETKRRSLREELLRTDPNGDWVIKE